MINWILFGVDNATRIFPPLNSLYKNVKQQFSSPLFFSLSLLYLHHPQVAIAVYGNCALGNFILPHGKASRCGATGVDDVLYNLIFSIKRSLPSGKLHAMI
jgi:hypothetical protein